MTGHGAVLVTTREDTTKHTGEVITAHEVLTKEEAEKSRYDLNVALHGNDINAVIDSLRRGSDVNSYTPKSWDDESSSVIMHAARVGFDEAVKVLLEMGADPYLDKMQGSVLGTAAYHGHDKVIEVCFDHEESTGYTFDEKSYNTAVGNCLKKSKTDALKTLLARRLDKVNLNNDYPAQCFSDAAYRGHLEILELLASNDKLPTTSTIRTTAMTKAIEGMQLPVLHYLLHEAHFDINALNTKGETLLMCALDNSICHPRSSDRIDEEERKDLIRSLLDASADINQPHRDGKGTALHFAIDNHVVSVIPLLLSWGADVLMQNDFWDRLYNALQFAPHRKLGAAYTILFDAPIPDPQARAKYATEAFFIAAKEGHQELMVRALSEVPVDTRCPEPGPDNNRTALLIAIHGGYVSMARMLIRNVADQSIADENGTLPLLLAAKRGMALLVKDLVKTKGSPGLEVTGNNGNTPLMVAVMKGREATVRGLLGLGVDREARNDFWETAEDLAERHTDVGVRDRIVKLLEG